MTTKVKPPNQLKRRELPEKFEAGFLRDIDKRTEIYQRLNSSYEAIIADVGGIDQIPRTKLALIERFVFLEVKIQIWEMEMLTSTAKANELSGKWTLASNTLIGLAKTIGLKRHGKVVTLEGYVAEKDGKSKR